MKKSIKTFLRVVITLPVFILLGIVHGLSQVPAFPGAEGFGKNATGGRGGKIIFVTNLNDSGEGSLRAAVEEIGSRTVLFKVGGVINLRSTLTIANPDITIAGQSAPGDGICLKSNGSRGIYLMNIKTNNVIVRHIKFRRGPSTEGGECNGDALAMLGAQNCIIDHCSFSWTTDELISSWPAQNITVQWCTFAEALHNSTHSDDCDPDGPLKPHALGPLVGNASDKITFYRNLFANNTGRNPQISPTEGGQFQLVNNVVYNTCYAITLAGKNGNEINVNAVGNYIKWGPNSCENNRNNILLSGNTKVYVEDNLTPFRSEGDDQWLATSEFRKQTPARTIFQANRPFAMPEVPTISAANAYREVPLQAGAIKVSNAEGAIVIKRDPVDQRTLADVTSGTATSGTSGRRLDHPNDVGGWPTYASGTPPADSDNDGMPDAWENKYGLNPDNAADNNKDTDGDGYLNVEEFLNETDPTSTLSDGPAEEDFPVAGQWYYLENQKSNMWLTADACTENSSVRVSDESTEEAHWRLVAHDDGTYSLQNGQCSDRWLETDECSLVRLRGGRNSSKDVRWRLIETEGGYYHLENQECDKRLDWDEGNRVDANDGTDIDKRWRFVAVKESNGEEALRRSATLAAKDRSLVVYPNPVGDVLRMRGTIFSQREPEPPKVNGSYTTRERTGTVLRILSLTGQTLIRQPLDASGEVSVSALWPGMYIVKVTRDGTQQQTKFIKQ